MGDISLSRSYLRGGYSGSASFYGGSGGCSATGTSSSSAMMIGFSCVPPISMAFTTTLSFVVFCFLIQGSKGSFQIFHASKGAALNHPNHIDALIPILHSPHSPPFAPNNKNREVSKSSTHRDPSSSSLTNHPPPPSLLKLGDVQISFPFSSFVLSFSSTNADLDWNISSLVPLREVESSCRGNRGFSLVSRPMSRGPQETAQSASQLPTTLQLPSGATRDLWRGDAAVQLLLQWKNESGGAFVFSGCSTPIRRQHSDSRYDGHDAGVFD
ncbi:hypothetical protein Drorol1_Dr00022616 [Drosera rotundifolia]